MARIKSEPNNWWNVRDVADLYARYFNEARLRRAENAILAPLGLDKGSFIGRQRELDPQLVQTLAAELRSFNAPDVETIFVGIDTTGAHVYVAYNSEISCLDAVGFAAIGYGARHASSELMFAKHTNQRPLPETFLLVYSAKEKGRSGTRRRHRH